MDCSSAGSAGATDSGSILAGVRGFVFDLDGCVWNGSALNPGAGEALAALHGADRGLVFLTHNSRATAADLRRRLRALGIPLAARTPTTPEVTAAGAPRGGRRGRRWAAGRRGETGAPALPDRARASRARVGGDRDGRRQRGVGYEGRPAARDAHRPVRARRRGVRPRGRSGRALLRGARACGRRGVGLGEPRRLEPRLTAVVL